LLYLYVRLVLSMPKQFALIGHPLGHSISPEIHERLFALSGVDASYRLLPVPPQKLPGRLPELASLDGFNVTIPHKETLAAAVASLGESAARYRSVNTVSPTPEGLRGYNTDCDGFLRSLASQRIEIGKNVCVLGAGGVGRMFATECVLHGADLTLAVRKALSKRPRCSPPGCGSSRRGAACGFCRCGSCPKIPSATVCSSTPLPAACSRR
jgi:shikimate dehydrogenase